MVVFLVKQGQWNQMFKFAKHAFHSKQIIYFKMM